MNDTATRHAEAAQLLYAEARALDERRWDDWLAMLHPSVVYWVPAWTSDFETTRDPDRELSLIYYESRSGLEERVARARSGRSLASSIARRTLHAYTNVSATPDGPDAFHCHAALHCDIHDLRARRSYAHFGRTLHRFVRADAQSPWRIAARRCELLNDHIPGMIDFYCV
ncbi:MAG: aromatic-ring-hydroxylating dioxygenase subunit beta [Burkholderiaceae bacterium]